MTDSLHSSMDAVVDLLKDFFKNPISNAETLRDLEPLKKECDHFYELFTKEFSSLKKQCKTKEEKKLLKTTGNPLQNLFNTRSTEIFNRRKYLQQREKLNEIHSTQNDGTSVM